jgi:acyl dehydratase
VSKRTPMPDLPPILESYRAMMESRIGQRSQHYLGVVDALLIRRYAVAIDDPNPVYHDADAARAAGYEDIVAPPNLLSAIVDWGAGAFDHALRSDGTTGMGDAHGLRIMGAGEEMEFLKPVVAGSKVFAEELVERVEVKVGRSGPLIFVTWAHDFVDENNEPYNRNHRTVMVRL